MRISDWSSDVCSSDLTADQITPGGKRATLRRVQQPSLLGYAQHGLAEARLLEGAEHERARREPKAEQNVEVVHPEHVEMHAPHALRVFAHHLSMAAWIPLRVPLDRKSTRLNSSH